MHLRAWPAPLTRFERPLFFSSTRFYRLHVEWSCVAALEPLVDRILQIRDFLCAHLISTNQVSDVIAIIRIKTRFYLLVYPLAHRVGERDVHCRHGQAPLLKRVFPIENKVVGNLCQRLLIHREHKSLKRLS